MIILPGEVIVNFIRIIRNVSHLLDFRADCSVKPPIVPQFAHHVLLVVIQLQHALFPQLLGPPRPGSDPRSPVKPLKPGHNCLQALPLAIFEVIELDPEPVLVHLLPRVEDVVLLDAGLGVLGALVVGVSVPIVHESPEAPGLSQTQGGGDRGPGQDLAQRRALL